MVKLFRGSCGSAVAHLKFMIEKYQSESRVHSASGFYTFLAVSATGIV